MCQIFQNRCENVWCDEALLTFLQWLQNSPQVTRKNVALDGQNKNVRNGKKTVYDLSFNSNKNLAPVRFVTVAKKLVTSHVPSKELTEHIGGLHVTMNVAFPVDELETSGKRAENGQEPVLGHTSAFLRPPVGVQGHRTILHDEVAVGVLRLHVEKFHNVLVSQVEHGNALVVEDVIHFAL